MTERTLKYSAGLFLIVSHIGLLGYSIGLFMQNGFNIDEFTTVAAVITPVFAGYTTSIISFVIKEAKITKDTSGEVTLAYVLLTFALPLFLVGGLATSIGLKAHNLVFANFEDFKRFLLLLESMFAAYVGMFVYSLFGKQSAQGDVAAPKAGVTE